LLLSALGIVAVGAALPVSPFAHALGFTPLPVGFFLTLIVMVAAYLVLIELGKRWFFRAAPTVPDTRRSPPPPGKERATASSWVDTEPSRRPRTASTVTR
jgi:Mg2+-importing ATPase